MRFYAEVRVGVGIVIPSQLGVDSRDRLFPITCSAFYASAVVHSWWTNGGEMAEGNSPETRANGKRESGWIMKGGNWERLRLLSEHPFDL